MKKRTLTIINNCIQIEENVNAIENNVEYENISLLSDKEFLAKHIWIINKQKKRQLFTINEVQEIIENKIIELRQQGIPPRIIVLKARQQGVTTYSQGKMMKESSQLRDRNSLIVAQDKEAVAGIFAKSKFMYEELDEDIKPMQRASNARELVFNTPTHYKGKEKGLNSKIVVKIAGVESIGRGDTYSFVHMSEFAFWKGKDDNSPENQLNSIMQAVPDTLDSLAIIESTAKGFNCFKDVWDKAVNGENGWCPLFFAWHQFKEYRKPFKNEEEKRLFANSLDSYEREIKNTFDLELEQLNWHRHTKKTKCNNNLDLMRQENPSSPEEAFIFTGLPVFDNDKIKTRINYLTKLYKQKPYITGLFKFNESQNQILDNSISFKCEKENDIFIIKIYEKVKPGYRYSLGADTKGEGKDKYTATVVNVVTQKVAAVLKCRLDNSKMFAFQLYCMGKYYNNALIGVEMNFNTAPIERLNDLKYPKQYQREVEDNLTGKLQKKYGWKTTKITRANMIDYHIEFVNEHIQCFNDIETLQEMLTFVRDESFHPDAMSGKHDDLLFSHMIANAIQSQQPRRIDATSSINVKFNEEVQEEKEIESDEQILQKIFS